MATITTRAGKGSPLTNTEVDSNFTNLNTDKLEDSDLSVTTTSASSGGTLAYTSGVFTFAPADLSSYITNLSGLGITATAAELNVLDGIPATLTTAELGYVDGVTSSIQTQLNAKGVGSVTSVGGTGTVNGLTLTGTVTGSGNLTLGGTLDDINLASGVTGTLPIANGGTGGTSAAAALTNFGLTATVAEINVLDGIPAGLTATELGYVDGVTSAIQTQINGKEPADATILKDADIGSSVLAFDTNLQAFVTAFTVPTSDGTTGQALITDGSGTIAFGNVDALPSQSGNSGKYLTTDGTAASWASVAAGGGRTDIVIANSSGADYVVQNAYEIAPTNLTITGTWQIFSGSTVLQTVLQIVEAASIAAINDYFIATQTIASSQVFYKIGYIADLATITVNSGVILQGIGTEVEGDASGSTAAQSYATQFKYEF